LKTASLIANSCEAIAILNNSDPVQIEAARDFGKHIGLAFQIQDDRLDFIADAEQLGKPACADLNLGLSTAPVLYASEEFEFEMIPMMSRRFSKEGDVQRAFDIIKNKRFNSFLVPLCVQIEQNSRQINQMTWSRSTLPN